MNEIIEQLSALTGMKTKICEKILKEYSSFVISKFSKDQLLDLNGIGQFSIVEITEDEKIKKQIKFDPSSRLEALFE